MAKLRRKTSETANNQVIRAVSRGNLKRTQTLLSSGANINASDKERRSLLHIAIYSENLKLIRFLISQHPNLNAGDSDKLNVVDLAILRERLDIAHLLLCSGAKPSRSMGWLEALQADNHHELAGLLWSWFRGWYRREEKYLRTFNWNAQTSSILLDSAIVSFMSSSAKEIAAKTCKCLYCDKAIKSDLTPCDCIYDSTGDIWPYYLPPDAYSALNNKINRTQHSLKMMKKRRKLLTKSNSFHTDDDINCILGLQQDKCYYCESRLKSYEIDHIVPISKGGTDWPSNLALTCSSCNRKKCSSGQQMLWSFLKKTKGEDWLIQHKSKLAEQRKAKSKLTRLRKKAGREGGLSTF